MDGWMNGQTYIDRWTDTYIDWQNIQAEERTDAQTKKPRFGPFPCAGYEAAAGLLACPQYAAPIAQKSRQV